DLTSTGVLIGTISYMSPEQVSGERVVARSDVFSLGGVLAYAATGRGPFEAPTMPAIASRIVGGTPDLGGISGPLRTTVEACLVKAPAARAPLDAVTAHPTGTARQDTYVPPTSGQTRYPERITASVPFPQPPAPPAPRTLAAPMTPEPRKSSAVPMA